MPGNSFGHYFKITSFGESHGKVIGIIIDGCPAGLEIDFDFIQSELNKRRPGQSELTTSRKELDKAINYSGIFNSKTTGAPLCFIIENRDIDSSKYEKYKDILRPSQVDYSALKRYGGYADYRGSGRFSGRITAGFVIAGAIAKLLLNKLGIQIFAYTKRIGDIEDNSDYKEIPLENLRKLRENNKVRALNPEKANEMENLIEKVKKENDSIGGIIKCVVLNMPEGIGDPVFDSLESTISHAIFSIPAIKGIEFGTGFKAATMLGSQHNDPWYIEKGKIKTLKNDAGGIIGGISTGMPIEFNVVVKPTATIGKRQQTVNIKTKENVSIELEGRHDPCIVPRAVVVVEAMTAIVLVDHLIGQGRIPLILENNNS
ncbi:MAG: chorismate synthase [Promethearchaeia archaeon]